MIIYKNMINTWDYLVNSKEMFNIWVMMIIMILVTL